MESRNHLRFLDPHAHLGPAFGSDTFGRFAERTARFFGTPYYLIGQTGLVIVWLAVNAAGLVQFDEYPFILLNLAFSTQAAYAAPMILLAETRQAERDKHWSEADAGHREQISERTLELLDQNTRLTEKVHELSLQIARLTEQVHANVVKGDPAPFGRLDD
ncbi:MAG: DUF1003 domain-containing protein [Dehalococcoidia bacterium]